MQDRVKCINFNIKTSQEQAGYHKNKVADKVNEVELQQCQEFINKVREERFKKVRDRQVSKFKLLQDRIDRNKRNLGQASVDNHRTIGSENANQN